MTSQETDRATHSKARRGRSVVDFVLPLEGKPLPPLPPLFLLLLRPPIRAPALAELLLLLLVALPRPPPALLLALELPFVPAHTALLLCCGSAAPSPPPPPLMTRTLPPTHVTIAATSGKN